MNPTSTESGETRVEKTASSRLGLSEINAQVHQCASDSTTQSEFLRLLASAMADSFDAGIIAVESAQWAGPMMFVKDESLAKSVDRDTIMTLLQNAAVVPIAADVNLQTPTIDGTDKTRALRVELCESPSRAAILLIYGLAAQPSATDQLYDLKQLDLYVDSIRNEMMSVPVDALNRDIAVSSEGVAGALRNRQTLCLFHRDLDIDSTAYRIANESRRLLKCDRTTVLIPKGKRFRVQAISGVSVIDKRSNSIKAVEELATRAAVLSRPIMLPGDEPLPPQIQEPLDTYLDDTGVTTAVMLPLHAPSTDDDVVGIDADTVNPFEGAGDIIAMMCLEYFAGEPVAPLGPATTLVATEAMVSLRNAQEHEQVFGLKLWKSIGGVTRHSKFPLMVAGSLLFVGLIVASLFIQTEHHVIATGSVEPAQKRQVFATVDGVVKKILATDGKKVQAGDPLFELENADLESQAETLFGEIQTATKRLSSIQSVRLSSAGDSTQSGRLALEERQLTSELANLRAQQELVRRQQKDLVITSPISGTVVGWQLQRRLVDRPVSRGNLLVSIVNHDGPWSLRLQVPDHDAGPVLEAFQGKGDLPIKFAVATNPNASFAASLKDVSTAARLDANGDHVIDATAMVPLIDAKASVDDNATETQVSLAGGVGSFDVEKFAIGDGDLDTFDPQNVRIGADVTARIACGKRSIMRSWFSDVFDFVNRNVLFYFR